MLNLQRKSISSRTTSDCRVPRPEADEIRPRVKSDRPAFSRLQYRLWSWHEKLFRTNGLIYQPVVCSILFHGCHGEEGMAYKPLYSVQQRRSFINLSTERLIDHMHVTLTHEVDRDLGGSYHTERTLVSTGTQYPTWSEEQSNLLARVLYMPTVPIVQVNGRQLFT